ncbi:hypothetical protein FisN_12Hh086 [Fistulifera solaris]|uniref:RZ-type domain-containing protein n=1 Tax=Fistulifera solaris TaxID=1519565 RepID=A0A1Z5KQG8_FISSO|nr:hypothetical protein FisN_12Hh086 [Fistulifera solaris]|eukprot:GAX28546.1 hypothetical protein FisN_12Hh086 [Fistulifera solaris]
MESVDTLHQKGRLYCRQIEKHLESTTVNIDDFDLKECLDKARTTFQRGIDMAFEQGCTYSGATLRLSCASLLARVCMSGRISSDAYQEEGLSMLNWIITHEGAVVHDVVARARTEKLQLENADIVQIVQAMSVVSGYDYGGPWSDHWYECPNGHPYFIGECGRAAFESNCIECGARIGGIGHNLLESNRPANSLISRARASIPKL